VPQQQRRSQRRWWSLVGCVCAYYSGT
jgi:hypothetical protein